ncbi:MAG TPA: glycosyltransferase, partial [Armatimonadota bacterium]|nr:glycosyltransferase [Armatimonadota bacterium]
LYRAATAFVFPSHYEGFGLPILEAMGCSCPVITSTQSCLPEIAGDAAVTVHPDDTEALADALRRVSENESLREQLRARGKARVAQFSWQRCAAETLKVYEHVAGRE